jgi:hypothetical protein
LVNPSDFVIAPPILSTEFGDTLFDPIWNMWRGRKYTPKLFLEPESTLREATKPSMSFSQWFADHLSVFIEHTQIKNLKLFSQYVALSEEHQIQARSELLHLFKEKEFVCLYVLRDLNNPDKLRWRLENDVRKIQFVEDRVVDHLLDECEGDHVDTDQECGEESDISSTNDDDEDVVQEDEYGRLIVESEEEDLMDDQETDVSDQMELQFTSDKESTHSGSEVTSDFGDVISDQLSD